MTDTTITCPRCCTPARVRPGLRFCPRCGLPDVQAAASDAAPADVAVAGRTYRVLDRIGVGSVSAVYRCRFGSPDAGRGERESEGVFKIARDPRANALIAHEASVLRRLHALDTGGRFSPFFPAVEASLAFTGASDASPRHANILRVHPSIAFPADELYTLTEVRDGYPDGLDARDVAWIWRRLLTVLGFAHTHGFAHAAVLPPHVLVEPREHKLVLIDWCCATECGAASRRPAILDGVYMQWYRRAGASRGVPTPALDVSFAARCMIELLGGDPLTADVPASVDPAICRYFARCVAGASGGPNPGASKLLDEFDHLIGVLWGPRTFRVLALPPKTTTP